MKTPTMKQQHCKIQPPKWTGLEQGAALDLGADTISDLLPDGVTLSAEAEEAFTELENANSIDELVQAQAKVLDTVAPDAPELSLNEQSDTGSSAQDALTNDTNPTVRIDFDTLANDGTAVVAGDNLQIFKSGILAEEYKILAKDVEAGFVERDLINLEQGDFFVSAGITDRAGNASYVSSLKITIDTDAPEFTSANIATEIKENSNVSLNKVIYTAAATDSAAISLSLSGDSDAALSLNGATGEVILTENPDFEAQSQYSFTLVATDAAGNTSEHLVTLDIANIDDTAPVITSGNIAAAIDENSGINQLVYTATADDSADVSEGLTFSLAEGSDAALTINADTGAVVLTIDPDQETQGQYSFAVIATDVAGNASEAQSVTLDISNIDDSAPVVSSGVIADAIDENSGAGQVVYTATADDSGDISEGVTFSLAAGSDGPLSIDAVSGEVTLAADPDQETQDQYTFAVIATDAAGNTSEAQPVTLAINDLDDTAPLITSAGSVEKGEGSSIGTVIYTATADDSADVSDGVSFSLAAGSDANVIIDAATGEVSLLVVPAFEVQNTFDFTVIATDNAGNASESKDVILSITTTDDVDPVFISPVSVSVDEDSVVGDTIYTAVADDANNVTYSLADGADIALSIDSQTGEVSLGESLDFETDNEYSFTVTATDTKGNVSQQVIALNVANIDEVAPVIISGETAVAIDENSGANQVIYTATADDSIDTSEGVTFSLAAGSDAALSINADTGAVTLATDPDQETQAQYSFSVVATDAAGNASAAQSVTFEINDLDDTAAVITSGGSAISIDENSGADQVIYTAIADDSADISGGLTFSLTGDSDTALSINADTGAVTLAADPDQEAQSQYSFAVIATDAAGNESAAQSVTLDINDLDDTAPVITSSNAAATINENSGGNQVIYTATADDSADISGGVTFSLAEGSDVALTIDAQTGAVSGEVVLTSDPDQESQSLYSFTVVATDAAGNTVQQAVTLDINDLDEQAPVFDSSSVTESIYENVTQPLFTALADDSADISEGLTYSIELDEVIHSKLGAVEQRFVENNDGSLTLQLFLDSSYFESSDLGVGYGADFRIYYSVDEVVEIQASQISSSAPLGAASPNAENPGTIGVAQLYLGGSSSFDSATPILEIDFNLQQGVTSAQFEVAKLTTSDDMGDSGIVTSDYGDLPSVSRYLGDKDVSIDSLTGEVTLGGDRAPYFEVQPLYSFTVTATDTAGNASEQSVVININDISVPLITSGNVADAVDENAAATVIYTATADNAESFKLSEDSDASLSIDSETGVVTFAGNSDYETQSNYTFTVIATNEQGYDSAGKLVTLAVNNLDEIAPTITSDTEANVLAAGQSNPVIYTATADDSADISGGLSFSLEDTTQYAGAGTGTGSSESTVTIPQLAANTQTVYVSSSTKSEDGTQETVIISYNSDDTTATGLGLRVHYDSSSVSLVGTPETNAFGALVIGPTSQADSGNEDIDDSTDSIVNVGWVSFGGNWPGSGPVELATLTFDIAEGAAGTSPINFSFSSNDANQSVAGQTHELAFGGDAGPVESQLSINATTGEVSLAGELNPEVQADYSFTVTATDAAGIAAQQQVAVTVEASLPEITSGDAALSVDENAAATVIYTATADNAVSFKLADNSDSVFTIDAQTGEVTLAANADYETQSNYTFTVIATNEQGYDSAGKLVTLAVNNLDEIAPTITSDTEANVLAAGQSNPVIYTATADDSADISGGLSFSLEDTTQYAGAGTGTGSSESTVTIPQLAANTQTVYVSSSTKSEDGTQETVIISYNSDDTTATGLGLRVHYDSSSVSLVGTPETNAFGALVIGPTSQADSGNEDIDDSTDSIVNVGWVSFGGNWPGSGPVELATLTFDIAEGATGTSPINFSFSSNDANQSVAGQTHELALGGDAGPVESQLSINATTGEVSLAGELNPEVQADYSFTVTATDAAGDAAQQQVVVDVELPMVNEAIVVLEKGQDVSAPIYEADANVNNLTYQIADTTPESDAGGSGSSESTVTIPQLAANTQTIYVSSSTKSEDGTQETVVVSYNSDDTTATGLGMRLHYDSAALSLVGTPSTNAFGALVIGPTLQDDSGNEDINDSTDSIVNVGWVSFGGNWPGSGPVELATLTFDIAEGATGTSPINFSFSSNDANQSVAGQSHDVVLSAAPVAQGPELVIDNATGAVSFDAVPDTVGRYSFTVDATDANGQAIGGQTVPVIVVDQVVTSDSDNYTGTAEADVFALVGGAALITSGAGEDVFIFTPGDEEPSSAMHTIIDFESGVDSIDVTAALIALGYSAQTITKLNDVEISSDILDLVSANDSSLDNVLGGLFDDSTNVLTVFADTNVAEGVTEVDTYMIEVGESSTVNNEDITVSFSSFIA